MASNRKGFPEQIKELSKQYSSKPRGSGICVRDNEVVCTVWKDTKCVTVGTNQHPGHSDTTVVRNWKKKRKKTKKCSNSNCYTLL